jgi:type II secretory pathway component PulM
MIDPITAPLAFGPYLATSLLCLGLFIWSQITMVIFKNNIENHLESDEKNFTDLKQTQTSILTQQSAVLSSVRDVAESINRLADAITTQSNMHREQLELLRVQSGDIKVMLANQTAAQGNLQKLLEQVVSKMI